MDESRRKNKSPTDLFEFYEECTGKYLYTKGNGVKDGSDKDTTLCK